MRLPKKRCSMWSTSPCTRLLPRFRGCVPRTKATISLSARPPAWKNLINVAGIASPGLSSAPAIAVHVRDLVEKLTHAAQNKRFNPIRKAFPRFGT